MLVLKYGWINKYDGKSDIWSLGWVIFEWMMHQPPFKEQWAKFDIEAIINSDVPRITSPYGYSDDLGQLVNLMLKVDTDFRPTAAKILSYPIVREMEEKYLSSLNLPEGGEINDKKISKTIFMPENPVWLHFRLPKSNFENTPKIEDSDILPKFDQKKGSSRL